MSERTLRVQRWFGTRPAKVALVVVGVLVIARLLLPYIVKTIVNDRLASMDGYRGRVLDIDISLLRGAYVIRDLRIEKVDGDVPVPFLTAPEIDISLEWAALLHGSVVAELVFQDPEMNFVGGRASQMGGGNDWRDVVDDLVPITINRLEIHRGRIHYRDYSASPDVDVLLSGLEVQGTGLSTEHDEANPLPAHIDAHGTVQRSGNLEFAVRLDPWAERPTFDLDLGMESLNARELNRLLRAYAGVDAEAGRFYVYSEVQSRNGQFRGYVKPMTEGLSLFRFGEGGDAFDQFGDLMLQLVVDLFENHGTDRFATRVHVAGSIEDVQTDGWEAILGVLANSFIEAIEHGVERPFASWRADRSSSPVGR